MAEQFSDIVQSFGRANMSGKLYDTFYDIFLASNPNIGPHFKDTDLVVQKKLLRQGLNLVLMFAQGQPTGQIGIARIRDSHTKTKLNIHPSLYPYWLDSFIKAVAKHDPQFTLKIEQRWRQALQIAVDFIVEGYENPNQKVA